MTNEKLQEAVKLAEQIDNVKEYLLHCNIMLDNHHDQLTVMSSMCFKVPKDIANGILQLSKDALERQLADLEKQFNEI